jgi:hypothetical protein
MTLAFWASANDGANSRDVMMIERMSAADDRNENMTPPED